MKVTHLTSKPRTIAVVGATGIVGEEIVAQLEERGLPVGALIPLASSRSLGRSVSFAGEELPVQVLSQASFAGVELALFAAGPAVSREYVPLARKAGALVVDCSTAFRSELEVPLVVPEVNGGELVRQRGIVASPGAAAIALSLVLAPLRRQARIRRAVVVVCESAAGAGRRGMDELSQQGIRLLNGTVPPQPRVMPRRLAFNLIPQVGELSEDGTSSAETLLALETARILGPPAVPVSATCVRVPVFSGLAEAVHLELERELDPDAARDLLRQASGLVVLDDPEAGVYPTLLEAAGNDPCFVGRIRRDPTLPSGLALWIAIDDVRKGAALNAVQLAQMMLED